MTPAARSAVEAVHAGATLTMHYRPKDGAENERCFVLEPRGKRVFAPTAILAVRSGHLKAADDGLPGLAVTQTWTAGEPLPPQEWQPPAIKGSTIRDTLIRGLTISFDGEIAKVSLKQSGEPLFKPFIMTNGKRKFVARVDNSELGTIEWHALKSLADVTEAHRVAARTAAMQIAGDAP